MKNLIRVTVLLFFLAQYAIAQEVAPEVSSTPQAALNSTNNVSVSLNGNRNLNGQNSDGPERSKTFSKTFATDNQDKIILGNQYGSILIKTWDRKEVKADILIKAFSNSEEEAQKLLDGVSIEAGKNGDQIIFKTKIEQESKSWRNGKQRRREVKVDYVVYMPASSALTLSQNYGNVNVGSLSGPLYAKVQYGDFSAANLSNNNNYISVQYGKADITNLDAAVIKQEYGSGLTIGSVGTLDLDIQYAGVNINTIKGNAVIKQQYGSGLVIGSVNNLDLNVQYANVNVNTIKGNAKIRQQYNNLGIGTVGALDLNAEYANASIGTLKGNGNFHMEYNKLNINEVTIACKALNIEGSYLGIAVNFNDSYSADFMVNTSYASFNYGNRVSAKQTGNSDDSTTKNYVGKIGNGGGAAVKIKSDYGSVTFK